LYADVLANGDALISLSLIKQSVLVRVIENPNTNSSTFHNYHLTDTNAHFAASATSSIGAGTDWLAGRLVKSFSLKALKSRGESKEINDTFA
jgi:hypothetical protein